MGLTIGWSISSRYFKPVREPKPSPSLLQICHAQKCNNWYTGIFPILISKQVFCHHESQHKIAIRQRKEQIDYDVVANFCVLFPNVGKFCDAPTLIRDVWLVYNWALRFAWWRLIITVWEKYVYRLLSEIHHLVYSTFETVPLDNTGQIKVPMDYNTSWTSRF